MKMPQHIHLQGLLTGTQLAPGNFAIAVPIQADREFAVANRQLQRTRDLRIMDVEIEEAIAGDMCLGKRAGERRHQPEPAPRFAPERAQRMTQRVHRDATAAMAFTRTSLKPSMRTNSSAGSAAAGLPAALAAFTSTSTSSGSRCPVQFSSAAARLNAG